MNDNHITYIDNARSACLCTVGGGTYAAAVLVADDGRTDLVLVDQDRLGDGSTTYQHACQDAPHEQTGALPLEYVRRMTVAAVAARRQRGHRCGRPTQAGKPCKIRVTAAGAACEWHRAKVDGR